MSVRFGPTLIIQQKLISYSPMFKNIIYIIENILIIEYILKQNYKYINIYNLNQNDKYYLFLKHLNKFFLKSFSIHWVRLSFKGKGFRVRKFKKLNKMTLNFGHSHWTKLKLKFKKYYIKKIRRQNYILNFSNYKYLKYFTKTIKFIKLLNVYTKRGLRLKKQFIKRRFGKISQVVSSLH